MRVTFAPRLVLAAMLLTGAVRAADDLPPPIGTIDFYGLGAIPREKVASKLPFKVGERVARSSPKRKTEDLARALGVARVNFAFICCLQNGTVEAYVGIEPQGSKPLEYNTAPTGDIKLPATLLEADDRFGTALVAAIQANKADEDDSQGHALSTYPPLRAVQDEYIAFAREHVDLLEDVLANAADGRQRAVAAEVLGYAPDKRAIVEPLTRAALDPDDGVRNNATRALGVISQYSLAHPELHIRIDPSPFVAMMNSVIWTDRNKGGFVLTGLTASRDPEVLDRLRRDAFPALIEMCAWSNLGHAWSACLMLNRVLGMSDDMSDTARALALKRARFLEQWHERHG